MTDAIFDVVAKDKKEKHVAEDVRQAAVHEHRSDQGEVNGTRRRLQSRHFQGLTGERLKHDAVARDDVSASDDLCRNGRKRISELFVVAKALEKDKDEDVREDEQVVDYRPRAAVGVVIGDWEKHCCCTVLLPLPLGWGEGLRRRQTVVNDFSVCCALTLALSQREREVNPSVTCGRSFGKRNISGGEDAARLLLRPVTPCRPVAQ